jgi:uncharacterized repeat protein (TIGR03803 family)
MTNNVSCRCFVPSLRRGIASVAYGFVILITMLAATLSASAQTLTVLYAFTGTPDGSYPIAPVIRDAAGNLYGSTFEGGTDGFGTVFKLSKGGNETLLLSFNDSPGGGFPSQSLIRDAAGNFYGVALEGAGGSGVIFKLSPSGKERVLYNFVGGQNNNPKDPQGGLLMDTAGNLYGTTISGGVSACNTQERPYCGTVFKLAKNGKLTILHSFNGKSDGAGPSGNLLMDSAGNLYGTAFTGGDLECTLGDRPGCGVVFKLDTAGKETVLHRFTGKADGGGPAGSLLMDGAGNLYGSASVGGEFGGQCGVLGEDLGCGTIFKIDTAGKFSVLHSFNNDGSEGLNPNGGLVSDPDGNLYGTTQVSGTDGIGGTIFKVSKTGKLTVLFNFDGGESGALPFSGVIRDSKGNLYGTTYAGKGTVYELKP